jgi:hypothetical protein
LYTCLLISVVLRKGYINDFGTNNKWISVWNNGVKCDTGVTFVSCHKTNNKANGEVSFVMIQGYLHLYKDRL